MRWFGHHNEEQSRPAEATEVPAEVLKSGIVSALQDVYAQVQNCSFFAKCSQGSTYHYKRGSERNHILLCACDGVPTASLEQPDDDPCRSSKLVDRLDVFFVPETNIPQRIVIRTQPDLYKRAPRQFDLQDHLNSEQLQYIRRKLQGFVSEVPLIYEESAAGETHR